MHFIYSDQTTNVVMAQRGFACISEMDQKLKYMTKNVATQVSEGLLRCETVHQERWYSQDPF